MSGDRRQSLQINLRVPVSLHGLAKRVVDALKEDQDFRQAVIALLDNRAIKAVPTFMEEIVRRLDALEREQRDLMRRQELIAQVREQRRILGVPEVPADHGIAEDGFAEGGTADNARLQSKVELTYDRTPIDAETDDENGNDGASARLNDADVTPGPGHDAEGTPRA